MYAKEILSAKLLEGVKRRLKASLSPREEGSDSKERNLKVNILLLLKKKPDGGPTLCLEHLQS